jgi:hypothetical protein
MADTYSKLLGLSETQPPSSDSGKTKSIQARTQSEKKANLLANQQTSTSGNKKTSQPASLQTGKDIRPPISPPFRPEQPHDTTLLTTKEKTKYGTYLTDESIEKVRIRAIQLKRDDHQILQDAVNQYFVKLEK